MGPLTPGVAAAKFAQQRGGRATVNVVQYEIKSGRRWVQSCYVHLDHDTALAEAESLRGSPHIRKVDVSTVYLFK